VAAGPRADAASFAAAARPLPPAPDRKAAPAALEPTRPLVRYERDRPGELVHLDIKKLGKIGRVGHRIHDNRRTRVHGIGWEYTHVAIDDHSRLAYAEVLADETAETTAGFLRRAVAWHAVLGIAAERWLLLRADRPMFLAARTVGPLVNSKHR